MFNHEKLAEVISAYKGYFPAHWNDEKYKWEAIQHFQKHWDIYADNFSEMFMKATERTRNLLANMNSYPRGMIKAFAESDAEETRGMFINLFDESKDLAERMEWFLASAEKLRVKYDDGNWHQHYQTQNAITTYLWLKYPDKYYIYKYSEVWAFAKAIDSDFLPKKGRGVSNVQGTLKLYDEVREIIQKDFELNQMLKDALEDKCYPDLNKITMTIDIGFFASRFYKKETEEMWFPKDYSPKLSVQNWLTLLEDCSIFTAESLQIMRCFMDFGGEATCKQLAEKYGRSMNFYNAGSSYLAKRIAEKTGCPLFQGENEKSRYWPILYIGHTAGKDQDGTYVWRLRDELRSALEKMDLSEVELHGPSGEENLIEFVYTDYDKLQSNARFKKWLNPVIVALRELGGSAGTQDVYDKIIELYEVSEEELSQKHRSGISVIINDIDWAKNYLGYEGFLDSNSPRGIWTLSRLGERIIITDKLAGMIISKWVKILAAKRNNSPLPKINLEKFYEFLPEKMLKNEPYTKSDFLDQVYMDDVHYDTLAALLKNKKNLILQGAPGVGKTFAAKRLAYAIMEEMDDSRIEFIQFHQNYSYEDFIMGYKPCGEGFQLTNGIFYRACMNAANHPEKDYFFIIDEINRGNMSRIFGELLMLIEKDYREMEVTLAYSGTPFCVPKNLYIIGMMNTADRSLAMIDYALRRRFSFFEMSPAFHSDGFKTYQLSLQNEIFNDLIEKIIELNKEIKKDDSLGEGFQIGHSYFCGQNRVSCTEEWMKFVVYHEIIPLLREYWFDDKETVQRWENNLSGVFNDE